MNRRRWLLTVAAVTAFAAGILMARFWSSSAPAVSSTQQLMQVGFIDLAGNAQRLASFSGHPILINFWATWCAPCRREMPLLQAAHQEYGGAGLRIVGIALDNPESVRRFRDELDIGFPLWIDSGAGAQLLPGLGNTRGGLPFSLWLSPSGTAISYKLGAYNEAEFRAALASVIDLPKQK